MSMKKKIHSESGELAIESMLVMIPTLFVLVFLIAIGFVYYQQYDVQVTAADTANKIAQTYSFTDGNAITGEPSDNSFRKRPCYRYIINPQKYEEKNRSRAKEYAVEMLTRTSYASLNQDNLDVKFNVETDGLARRHVDVEVTATYKIPFAEGLEIFGIKSERQYTATASAECVDLMDYISTVNFVSKAGPLLIGKISGVSDIIKAVDSWMGAFKTIFDGN